MEPAFPSQAPLPNRRVPRGHPCLPGCPDEPPVSGTTAPRARGKTLADAKRDLLRVAVVRIDTRLRTHLTCMRHVSPPPWIDRKRDPGRHSHFARLLHLMQFRTVLAAAAGGAAAFADVAAARGAHF